MILSAESSEFLDPLYKRLETHPIVINACMSRMGGCSNDTLIQTPEELDILRKDKIYVWRKQNRLIVCMEPKIIFQGEMLFKDLYKSFDKSCLTGFGQRPVVLEYIEQLEETDDGLDNTGCPLVYHYVIEDIKWYELIRVPNLVAYVPLENGEVIPGAY